jgi:hypothetical protein
VKSKEVKTVNKLLQSRKETNETATNQYSIDRNQFDKILIGETFSEAHKTYQQQQQHNKHHQYQ